MFHVGLVLFVFQFFNTGSPGPPACASATLGLLCLLSAVDEVLII